MLLAPHVAKASAGAAEEIAEELGARDAQLIIRIWTALRQRAETSPASRRALEIAARGGPDAAGALQAPLMLVLQADTELMARLRGSLSRPNTEAEASGP